jgi:hypothetical protein
VNVRPEERKESYYAGHADDDRINNVRDKPQPESRVSHWLTRRPCLPNILRWLLLNRLRLERRSRRRGWIRSAGASLNGLTAIGAKCSVVGELRSTFRTKHIYAPNCPRASNQLTGLAHATQPETSGSTCKCRVALEARMEHDFVPSTDTLERRQKLHGASALA